MKIAIIGSRDYPELNKVTERLDKQAIVMPIEIITGGARGVDKTAEKWAKKHQVSCEIIKPTNPSIKISYLFRNVEILTKADKVIAFWDGKSKGTKFVIDYCKIRNKDLEIILCS